MYHGIINIYKEEGFTSHDVVAVLRKTLGMKKIGHTGTLDPQARGVLPICLGKGTKMAQLLTDKDKVYRTRFKLGQATDTQDHTGKVIMEAPLPSQEAVMEAIAKHIGKIHQVPPMYSAIKIDGKKLYELARAGKEIDRPARPVQIYSIEDLVIELPYVTMTVSCSKGTYIRTLCHDIAISAGSYGHMVDLERIQSGVFTCKEALKLETVKQLLADGQLHHKILALDALFPEYTKIMIADGYDKLLYNGNKLPFEAVNKKIKSINLVDAELVNVYNIDNVYMGIYRWSAKEGQLIPVRFFDMRADS